MGLVFFCVVMVNIIMAAITTIYNKTSAIYYNMNDCMSFKLSLGSSTLTALTSYPCSEVIIVNKTGNNITVFDNNNFGAANAFLLSNNESFTFRGITNTSMVSASAASAGDIYYRTQFFSSNPQKY